MSRHLSIPEPLYQRAEPFCKAIGTTPSRLVEEMLTEFLDDSGDIPPIGPRCNYITRSARRVKDQKIPAVECGKPATHHLPPRRPQAPLSAVTASVASPPQSPTEIP